MHLRKLDISNFRSIQSFSVDFVNHANLIVGPNAVGKTTVLEAIRLAKAVLAPRTQNEMRQVLGSLGVVSPNLPQQFNFAAIACDPTRPITINCLFELTDREVSLLPALTERMAQAVVASQVGIDLDSGQLAFVQYMSSPMGKQAILAARNQMSGRIVELAKDKVCKIYLTINQASGMVGEDSFSQAIYSVMERELPPHRTRFSYFPADRALPAGEAQIQLGSADAQQQLEAHNSNPSLKAARIKSTIFASLVGNNLSRDAQRETFRNIFLGLLKEKDLDRLEINQFGHASILVKDKQSGKSFDLDSMSSGEKGLILTFLLIARTLEDDGLLLIDEPEIHLNSAVCRDLLGFLAEQYLIPRNLQAIICTHSPEIMTSALRRQEGQILHMKRGKPAYAIRKSDHPEALDALRLLGTSEIEALLYDATIFVEGPDDVELLEYVFRDDLNRFKFRDLTGRGEVEKLITSLQSVEDDEPSGNVTYFLFDHDNKPSALKNSKRVVVKQWSKYCLENYLLDPEVLFDTVRNEGRPKDWPSSFGEAKELFKTLAKRQLRTRIVEEVYTEFGYQDIRLRRGDRSVDFATSATSLVSKLEKIKLEVKDLDAADWQAEFVIKCNSLLARKESGWDGSWRDHCNGKVFLQDVYQHAGVRMDMMTLKKQLLAENRRKSTENWKQLGQVFKDFLAKGF